VSFRYDHEGLYHLASEEKPDPEEKGGKDVIGGLSRGTASASTGQRERESFDSRESDIAAEIRVPGMRAKKSHSQTGGVVRSEKKQSRDCDERGQRQPQRKPYASERDAEPPGGAARGAEAFKDQRNLAKGK